jgi:hypothetical protein
MAMAPTLMRAMERPEPPPGLPLLALFVVLPLSPPLRAARSAARRCLRVVAPVEGWLSFELIEDHHAGGFDVSRQDTAESAMAQKS